MDAFFFAELNRKIKETESLIRSVKTHHHQGIDRMADGFAASAWATDDENVEALESGDGSFVLGVLWHPEEDPADGIIPALIARAAR